MFITWIHGLLKGKQSSEENPWNSSTLEWQTASPPTLYNFEKDPVITRHPYDYDAFRTEVKAGTSKGARDE
jgi:cytochrome c oxidase subunit 1